MISLAWKRILNQKYKSIVTVFALIFMIMIIAYGIQATNETKLLVTDSLGKYSRGSYDLLVRPEGASTEIEKKLQTVEENYIGDGEGGISILEWEEIKKLPDVEIAAPVASLGYFTSNTASISLPILDAPTHFEYQFFTSDGVQEYPVTPERGVYYLQEIDNEQLYAVDTYLDIEKEHHVFDLGLNISLPQNYHLLTAIDAESEGLLTGIDFSELFRELTPEESETIDSFSMYRDGAPVVPILQRSNFQIPLSVKVFVNPLDLTTETLYEKYDIPKGESIISEAQFFEDGKRGRFENDLLSSNTLKQDIYELDLTNYQSPFDGQHLVINEKFELDILGKDEGGTLYNDSGVYYTASKIDYHLKGDEIFVDIVAEGSPPEYKEVTELGNSYLNGWEAPFMIWQMGEFTVESQKEALASSPMGIYSTNEVKTTDDKIITPTISPGSFIASPAAGVTTLEAASFIKGDEPIDAIRIKLNHITTYDEKAQERIETLATKLVQDGFVVDIVAGSSFKNVNMHIEGIGPVTSPWTTLGVSQQLADVWQKDVALSIFLFVGFGILWIFSHLGFERNRLDEENNILTFLGWRKNHIRLKNMIEQIILLIISVLFTVVWGAIFGFSATAYTIIGSFLCCGILLIAIVFYSNRDPVKRTMMYKKFPSIQYYKGLLMPTISILLLAVCITQLQISSIYTLWTTSSETTLGVFLLTKGLSTRLLIGVGTIILGVVVLLEAIQAIFLARQDEIKTYYVIGWTKKMIKKHFQKEIAIWSVFALLLGIAVGFIIAILSGITLVGVMYGSVVSIIIYSVVVCMIASLPLKAL